MRGTSAIQQATNNTLQMPSSAPPSASSASGGSSSGVSGGSGSDSTAQAMWTAISNPLMLISHVLNKSMELHPPDSFQVEADQAAEPEPSFAAALALTTTAATAAPVCEFVSIEQHPEPLSTLRWIDADRYTRSTLTRY